MYIDWEGWGVKKRWPANKKDFVNTKLAGVNNFRKAICVDFCNGTEDQALIEKKAVIVPIEPDLKQVMRGMDALDKLHETDRSSNVPYNIYKAMIESGAKVAQKNAK